LTALNTVLRSEADGDRETTTIASREELADILKGPFGLKLAPETVARIWRRLEAQRPESQ